MKNRKNVFMRKLFVFVLIAAVVSIPCRLSAQEPAFTEKQDISGGMMVFDLLLVRPFGLAATLLGSTVFILAYPFTAANGDSDKAYEKLIQDPATFTFKRKLGVL